MNAYTVKVEARLDAIFNSELWDVVVEVKGLGVGKCSSLLHILSRDDLLHSYLNFL